MLLHSSEKATLERINNLTADIQNCISVCSSPFSQLAPGKTKTKRRNKYPEGEELVIGQACWAAGSRRWTAQKALQYKWQQKTCWTTDVTEASRVTFSCLKWTQLTDVQLWETCCRYPSETLAGNFLSHSKLKSRLQPSINNYVKDKISCMRLLVNRGRSSGWNEVFLTGLCSEESFQDLICDTHTSKTSQEIYKNILAWGPIFHQGAICDILAEFTAQFQHGGQSSAEYCMYEVDLEYKLCYGSKTVFGSLVKVFPQREFSFLGEKAGLVAAGRHRICTL